jgi:hypothetical protein
MNIDFEEILKELEFRLPTGIINLNEEHQVTMLVDILRENGVDDANHLAQKARGYFGFINEADADVIVKNKLSGHIYKVKKMDPSVHVIPKPAEIQAAKDFYGGKLPVSDKDPKVKGQAVFSGKGADVFAKEKEAFLNKKSSKTATTDYKNDNAVTQISSRDGKSFEGFRSGTTKAPGTPAGAFNEVGGMLAMGMIRKNPNVSDKEIADSLTKWAQGGKVTKAASVSGGDKLTAAVNSGRAIYTKAADVASQEGYDPKTTEMVGYWGSEDSKQNAIKHLTDIAKKNPKTTFNGLSLEEYTRIIKTGGGGEDPTDTFMVIHDGKSDNVSILHVSNKIGSNNIQANSTVKFTYDRIGKIVDEDKSLSTEEKDNSKKLIAKHTLQTVKLQKSQQDYQKSFLPKFASIKGAQLKSLAKDIYDEEGNVRRGDFVDKLFDDKGAISKDCKKLQKPHAACKLIGKKSSNEEKVQAMFSFYASNPDKTPASLREIVSRASTIKDSNGLQKYKVGYNPEEINKIYGQMNDEVEKMRQGMNKIKSGMGDRMLAKDFANRLHLTIAEGHRPNNIPPDRFQLVMGNNEADVWYDKNGQAYQKSKAGFNKINDDGSVDKNTVKLNQKEVNRGNISTVGNAENFKHCLGTPEGKKIEESINVKYDKINTKTGIQNAHVFDINNREIGIMTIRTKTGPGGDASDTIQFSKEMQNCMQIQEYKKRKK